MNTLQKRRPIGKREFHDLVRILTEVVKITGGKYSQLPVRTKKAAPKGMLIVA